MIRSRMKETKLDNTIIFRKRLMQWHLQHNTRQMPWKGIKDPYKIWLSEIILQQTRVEQGQQYYEKFVQYYPTIKHLAEAKDDDVFKLWEGLGYYSRCKNLLFTARRIIEKYRGEFPSTYKDIIELKGIGPYTAAAISSFAFNLPHAVVDGNVYRVLARYFGITIPSDSTEGKQIFTALAQECLDMQQPGQYNQAIMDFGATVCTPSNPLCGKCPIESTCIAFKKNIVSSLPVKTKLLCKRNRWFTYFVIEQDKKILVRKRDGKDIWQDLHEFFLEESQQQQNWDDEAIKKFAKEKMNHYIEAISKSEVYIQHLTHQTIYTQFIQIKTRSAFLPSGNYFFQPKEALQKLAFPKTIAQYIKQAFVQTSIF